jgi:hypothetical protein
MLQEEERMTRVHIPRRKAVAVAALAAVAGSAAAGVVSSSAGAAAKKKKPAVEILVAAAGSNTAFPHPGDFAGAQAAAIRMNKHGGINGQRIKIVTCNDQSERNATTACGRTAVSRQGDRDARSVRGVATGPAEGAQ